MYYLQSRYYNPTWGRFVNADALVSTGQGILGNNMFAYCRNNPVKRKDISGTNDLCVTDEDDDNPFNDLAMPSGGGGSGAGANAGGSEYVYGVDLSVPQRSALTTGGIYNNGYSPYGYSTSSACFVAGTLAQGEDGAVPIEDIKVGDFVWAWDEETGTIALKRVVETYVNQSDELIHIFVNGEEIVTTPTHPFYSPVKGWTAACKLRAGDILVTVNGEYVVVEKIQHEILEAPITVYNFQVEDYHTYYVSNADVLVHNSCHGNSLKDSRTNYGYQLQDKNGNILKYGETLHPSSRYTQKWLDNNEYSMKIMVSGTKIAVHMWQHQKIMDYAYVAGHLPPLNKSTW